MSYRKRVEEVNRIYDREARRGLSNREIWRRYVYPVYGLSERAFYYMLKASSRPSAQLPEDVMQLLLFRDDVPDKCPLRRDTKKNE